LYVEVEAGTAGQIIGQIYTVCSKAEVSVERIEVHTSDQEKKTETLEVACRTRIGQRLVQVANVIRSIDGVHEVHMDVPEEQLQSKEIAK
jgi:hypothetical protein